MLKIEQIRLDSRILQKTNRYRITENKTPVFSWSVISDGNSRVQKTYQVQLYCGQECIWDTGLITSEKQRVIYNGDPIVTEKKIKIRIFLEDCCGETAQKEDYFFISALDSYEKQWITMQKQSYEGALYFCRDITISKPIKTVTMYISGIGCHHLTINGKSVDDSVMEPAVSDYTKTVYFVMHPDLNDYFNSGLNRIGVVVGNCWRNNPGQYLHCVKDQYVAFFGTPQLCVIIHLGYEDGSCEIIKTDKTWSVGNGAITENNLFNGETYDAAKGAFRWDSANVFLPDFRMSDIAEAPGGAAHTITLEPIVVQEIYQPKVIRYTENAEVLIDFGQNIAGVCRVNLPQEMQVGQKVEIRYAEDYENNGELHFANLREAASRDVYIASGDERDLKCWQPEFTYHGFRYVLVKGLSNPDISAVSFYNDVINHSFFNCGSPVANAVQRAVVQTEKSNIYNLMTDCPQRDERMGWLNDATVRFEETPYNFETSGLFEKVLRDIADTQSDDGAITCTAPFIYGFRPADPVCSSFLVAGLSELLHSGNGELVRGYFDKFEKWEECLGSLADGFLISESHYGDWAAPVYACKDGDHDMNAAESGCTPGAFMSSCCYYYNATMLVKMANLLGLEEKENKYRVLAEHIRQAILDEWWNEKDSTICTGSQGCQSFALFLGIIPENHRAAAAKRLADDLIAGNLRFTTGNLCTRYLMDALSDNGFTDLAWELMTKEDYPSIGYMLQNDATTIWERFELKRLPDMNSYNHPMYGACGQWLYAYIAGIKPLSAGFETVLIKPHIPKKLFFAEAQVDTVKGCIWVKWFRRFGKMCLHLDIPFGVTAIVEFGGQTQKCGSGSWQFEINESLVII